MAERKYYWFIFGDLDGGRIRIRSKRKPAATTIPRRGTWVLQEFDLMAKPEISLSPGSINYAGKWVMPGFPEITWGRLSRLKFLGKEAA